MIDTEHARAEAVAIAAHVLGRDPGPMDHVGSRSAQVFLTPTLVVKIVGDGDHARLQREVILARAVPAGLTAPVLAHGTRPTSAGDVHWACLARLPGAAPGMDLPGADAATARRWVRQAVELLERLHCWTPDAPTVAVLQERLDHGGFVGRERMRRDVEQLRRVAHGVVPPAVLDGLADIADASPEHATVSVPVHADCHGGNWLVHEDRVTALLDLEWARLGEPADDWMFLARFSGPHMPAALEVIAKTTATPPADLRAACERREASHLMADLHLALSAPPDCAARSAIDRLVHELGELVPGRSWWRDAG